MAGDTNELSGMDGRTACDRVGDAGKPHDDGVRLARVSRNEVASELNRQTILAREIIAQTRSLVGDDAELIETSIEGETSLNEAVERAVSRLAELNTLMDAVAGMMADLKDRGERFEKQRDTLRELLAVALETAGKQRFELPLATIAIKRVPPKIEITNEASIPAKFWKAQDPKIDRKAVLAALKAGEAVPGAILSNGGTTIQVTFS